MSRTKTINLTLTTALAATFLAGCGQREAEWGDDPGNYADSDTAICVNEDGQRIDDDACDDDRRYGGGFATFIYLGRGGYIPYYGERARPGTYSTTPRVGTVYGRAPAAANMTRSAAVSRGGFGSSARSSGGRMSGRS
jgi:hypothetical protein